VIAAGPMPFRQRVPAAIPIWGCRQDLWRAARPRQAFSGWLPRRTSLSLIILFFNKKLIGNFGLYSKKLKFFGRVSFCGVLWRFVPSNFVNDRKIVTFHA
jgi:hypothetical protein